MVADVIQIGDTDLAGFQSTEARAGEERKSGERR
jgi:hypothetical protein